MKIQHIRNNLTFGLRQPSHSSNMDENLNMDENTINFGDRQENEYGKT